MTRGQAREGVGALNALLLGGDSSTKYITVDYFVGLDVGRQVGRWVGGWVWPRLPLTGPTKRPSLWKVHRV